MFTWIPIHEEAAPRLLEYKDRNHELVDLLAGMQAQGLKTTKITDEGPGGSVIQLQEIDPFTFFANFNRGTKDSNRQGLWRVLKESWHLKAEVPQDFAGLPIAHPQSSWLMPYARDRDPGHVPQLWNFYEHILSAEPESLDTEMMQTCLDLPQVGLAILTMGMFWACPNKWISADAKNVAFAETKGISGKPSNATSYFDWFSRVREAIGGSAVKFSRQAHEWATSSHTEGGYGAPFEKLFPGHNPDPVLDHFARIIGLLREEATNPDELLSMTLRKRGGGKIQIRLNIGMWAVTAIMAKPGERLIEFLVPFDHPEAIRYRKERQEESLEPTKGFAELIDGVRYDLSYLDEAEFFERLDELWPAIEDSVRKASRHMSGRRSPFRRHHRLELESLCIDKERREAILAKGMSFRAKVPEVPAEKRRYWLIAPGESAKYWDEWTEQGVAAIGWGEIGDPNAFESKSDIKTALSEAFPDRGDQAAVALMLWNFSHVIAEGDVIFAKLGPSEVIGWGLVRGESSFDATQNDLPNLLPVDWEEKEAVKFSEEQKLPMKSLIEITQDRELLDFLASSYSSVPGLRVPEDDVAVETVEKEKTLTPYLLEDALAELFMPRELLVHILEQLRRKKNIILQGAPGVGKTFIAKRLAWLQMGVKDESVVEMVQFHQSYTYEDFVQGLRPTKDGHFAVKDGCFYRLCRKALANPQQEYFLVIDEINRGNLSKILGELMMLIETDKRGEKLTLAYSEEAFTVPQNLYLIGTMNTADRSLSLVDYALRRRFAFLTLDPGFETDAFARHLGTQGITSEQIHHIRSLMSVLNEEISKDDTNLGAGFRIGHSFFTPVAPVADFSKWFQAIIRYEILPLLEEYWIDEPKMVQHYRLIFAEGMS